MGCVETGGVGAGFVITADGNVAVDGGLAVGIVVGNVESFSLKLEVGEIAAGFTGRPEGVTFEDMEAVVDVKGFERVKGVDDFFCLKVADATAAAAAAAA